MRGATRRRSRERTGKAGVGRGWRGGHTRLWLSRRVVHGRTSTRCVLAAEGVREREGGGLVGRGWRNAANVRRQSKDKSSALQPVRNAPLHVCLDGCGAPRRTNGSSVGVCVSVRDGRGGDAQDRTAGRQCTRLGSPPRSLPHTTGTPHSSRTERGRPLDVHDAHGGRKAPAVCSMRSLFSFVCLLFVFTCSRHRRARLRIRDGTRVVGEHRGWEGRGGRVEAAVHWGRPGEHSRRKGGGETSLILCSTKLQQSQLQHTHTDTQTHALHGISTRLFFHMCKWGQGASTT